MRIWPDHKVEAGLGFGSELGGSGVVPYKVRPLGFLHVRKRG